MDGRHAAAEQLPTTFAPSAPERAASPPQLGRRHQNVVKAILGVSARHEFGDNGKPMVKIGYAFAGVMAAFVLLGLGAVVHLWLWSRPISASIGDQATTALLIAGGILGAWTGFRYEAGRRKRRLHGLT